MAIDGTRGRVALLDRDSAKLVKVRLVEGSGRVGGRQGGDLLQSPTPDIAGHGGRRRRDRRTKKERSGRPDRHGPDGWSGLKSRIGEQMD